jgi:hypothetical protein
MVWTKEEKAVYMKNYNKKYREKNKEQLSEKQKKHRQENKEEKAEYNKKYYQTPAGKKASIIAGWKKMGLIHSDYDELYDKIYLPATHCQVCKKEFKDSFDKCMDHDHLTGLFRQVLCRDCNTNDNWKNK